MYLITIKKKGLDNKEETHDLYALYDNGTFVNETANSFLARNYTLNDVKQFCYYVRGEITEIVEVNNYSN
jgi:hypothetical protein